MSKRAYLRLTLCAVAVLGVACSAPRPQQAATKRPPPAATVLAQPATMLVLEVLESSEAMAQEVASNPDAETIDRVVRGLSWSDITFVILRKDENNYLEGSGSLNPSDGLSAKYMEDGVEHVSRSAPENLQVIVALLTSYRSGDGKWRTMIDWD